VGWIWPAGHIGKRPLAYINASYVLISIKVKHITSCERSVYSEVYKMVLSYLILCGICMTYIDAESNRSRISCIMVVAESDWMRIQNVPNKIGCGVKKIRVRTPLV